MAMFAPRRVPCPGLKEVALGEHGIMVVTFAVFQPLMSWLKEVALSNMALMFVT